MEDTLKRLLAAESRANQITKDAEQAAEKLVEDALRESRLQESRFQAQLPDMRAAFIDKAEQRAAQSLKEIQRRYDERLQQLRTAAEINGDDALDAAFGKLLGGEK